MTKNVKRDFMQFVGFQWQIWFFFPSSKELFPLLFPIHTWRKVLLSMQHHCSILNPFWQNLKFQLVTFEDVLQMVLWSEDTSTKKQALFRESPHCGQLWQWWKVVDEWGKGSWRTAVFCGTHCHVKLVDNGAGEKAEWVTVLNWIRCHCITFWHEGMWFHIFTLEVQKNRMNRWGWTDC